MPATYQKLPDGRYVSCTGKVMAKPGRPIKLCLPKLVLLLDSLGSGHTRREAADRIRVHRSTLHAWIAQDPTLAKAVEATEAKASRIRQRRLRDRHPFLGRRPPKKPQG